MASEPTALTAAVVSGGVAEGTLAPKDIQLCSWPGKETKLSSTLWEKGTVVLQMIRRPG